jgi:hypothetical protein
MSLPYSYEWEAWMRGVGKYRAYGPKDFARRPDVPKPVPVRWGKIYRERWVQCERAGLPWFGPGRSPFLGFVAVTAHDPQMIIRDGTVQKFDCIVLKGDGDDAVKGEDISALSGAGAKRFGFWYSWDTEPHWIPNVFPWIGQDEKPSDRAAYKAALARWGGRGVVFSNNSVGTLAAAREVFGEAYWNVNPEAKPWNVVGDAERQGAVWAAPMYGIGHENAPWSDAYTTFPLVAYEAAWRRPDRALYLYEYRTQADLAYIRSRP